MREFLAIALRRAGHDVTTAASGSAALERLRGAAFDLVVTDLMMPGEPDGLGVLTAIKGGEARPRGAAGQPPPLVPEVILITAYATAQTALAAMKQGAYD